MKLLDYSKHHIPVRGAVVIAVTYRTRTVLLFLYIVTEGTALLGLGGLVALDLKIDGSTLHCMGTVLELASDGKDMKTEFSELFSPYLGLAKGYIHRVRIRQGVAPVKSKLHRLLLAVREEVFRELTRLVEMNVIEPITVSEWVPPIVVYRKKDGIIRFSVDLSAPNKSVVPNCFPLPNTD